jgi:3-hydroxyacyl-CoA dehydrogenase / enoyl-CoA hydratase / 3-hydroxybutyryl-CoA epimerase
MTKPVLDHLGHIRLELGPAREAQVEKGWRAARDDAGVLWLVLDVEGQGVNTITDGVLRGLSDQLDRIEADPPQGVVIRSAKTAGFAVGADIGMLATMSDPDAATANLREGHGVLDRLEALTCPTIAVVHGAALGAGFEIVLACDMCIAIEGAYFGFPEVNLGLHPGLGGTFRLPARIDSTEAMTLMLTGKSAHTDKAKSLGIADVVTEERHLANAVRALIADGVSRPAPGLADRALALGPARSLAARRMRAKVEERAPHDHYPAPFALIDLWEEQSGDRAAMQAAEIASFAGLLASDTARNLMRVFRLRDRLKSDAPGDDGIARIHVIGAGAMGSAIAGWCALKGKIVTLSDPDWQQIGRAIPITRALCADNHLSALETRDALDRLIPDPQGDGIARADLVIEAGPEDAAIKAAIHADAEPRMKQGAILATNTSSLRLADLAKGLRRPTRFAGLHFFNPVGKMQLVEVVRTEKTYATVADALGALCTRLGKLPAHVVDAPGFLVNRVLMPYLMEAVQLIDEGVRKEAIDLTAERFGMPMGPVELADRVGLDICLDVVDSLRAQLDKPLPDVPDWFREKVRDEKHTGRKAGRGFYFWKDGEVEKIDSGSAPESDFTDRLILPMLDACVECLRKGVAEDADQIDAALSFGAGFAPFRGGPMHYARARGMRAVQDRLNELADANGACFRPDPGWADLTGNA